MATQLRLARAGPSVRVCILASSSSGNSTFVECGETRILVDAGLSRRATLARLARIGVAAESLTAILITHEHSDHVSGLAALVKKLNIPVWASVLTSRALEWAEGSAPQVVSFQAGTRFSIGDIRVESFTVPHDASDPVGFCLEGGGAKIGIATDLGYMPDSIRVHLRSADLLLLESNHDLEMLKVGPYPWSVKQRVMGRKGHLSNEVVSDYILDSLDPSTATLVLGHLSENNNHPEIVRLVADQALQRRSMSTRLVVAQPGVQSEVFEL